MTVDPVIYEESGVLSNIFNKVRQSKFTDIKINEEKLILISVKQGNTYNCRPNDLKSTFGYY
jgi:hypothetical protein